MPIPATPYKDYALKFPRALALYIKRLQRHKRVDVRTHFDGAKLSRRDEAGRKLSSSTCHVQTLGKHPCLWNKKEKIFPELDFCARSHPM